MTCPDGKFACKDKAAIKMGQNKPELETAGAIAGLRALAAHDAVGAMAAAR